MHHIKLNYLVTLLLFLGLAIFAFGQAETGNITGVVTDPSGATIPGATVTAVNQGTGLTRTDATTNNGTYTITNLSPGAYELTVRASGYSDYKQRIEVAVGGRSTLDAKLAVAGTTTVVEVTTEAGTQVNTQDQTLSQVVNATQIANLPSLTRNPYDFVAISGNISSDPNGSTSGTGGGVGVAFNGQRAASTDILLDGSENVDLFSAEVGQQVPLDSVQEYRVVTSDFTAEMGRAGGGVVNVATKAGTNTFHGSAYEYNRVSAFAANTYDESATNFIAAQTGGTRLPHDRFTRNQFGYSFGGPVWKNKIFFFNNTEWTRVRSAGQQVALVPTPQFLALTAPNTQAFFNTFGTLRPNAVPTGNFATDASGATITSGGVPVFQEVRYATASNAGAGDPQDAYSTVFRMDFNFTDKTQIFGRYALQRATLFPGTVSSSAYVGYDTGENDSNQNFLANITHIFSTNLVSTTKLSYNRFNTFQPLGSATLGPTLYLNRGNTASTINGVNVILPGNLPTTPGNGIPFGGPQNLYGINQDLSWVKGNHTFKFGGEYLQARDNRVFGAYETSVEQLGQSTPADGIAALLSGNIYNFQGAVDPQGKFPCFNDPNTGTVIQTPQCTLTLPVGSPQFGRNNTFNDGAVYAQDSWKVSPRLTLNLGVRWEYYGVQHNSNPNLDSNFYFAKGGTFFDNVRNGLVLTTPNSPIHKLYEQRFGNFAPRLGFAYDVLGDGKWSVRGGYGIGYERNFGNVTFNVIQNPPAYAVVSLLAGRDVPTIPISNDNAGPLAGSGIQVPLPATSLRAVDPNLQIAYAHTYSLAVEHELARNTVLALEYSGSRGLHQYSISNLNKSGFGAVYEGDGGAYGPGGPQPGTNPNGRLQTQYSNINFRGSNGDSYYNGLNVRLQSNNFASLGLQLTANYTYSHSIDNLSSTFSSSGNNFNLGYLDPFEPALDRGNSDFDTRHRFVFGGIYTPTYLAFKNSSKLVRNLFGGFQFAPIFTVRTGTPYTIFDCTNQVTSCPRILPVAGMSNTGSAATVPGVANLYNYLALPTEAVNPYVDPITGAPDVPTCTGPQGQGCTLPSPGIGRNHFLSPNNWSFNLGVYKNFAITERVNMQLRGEFYNILNHHNLYVNAAGADISSTDFIQAKKGAQGDTVAGFFPGTASANDERRNVQLALRIQF